MTVLVVVTGPPGTGKSTIAETLGRTEGIPVFAQDWMWAALAPFGIDSAKFGWQVAPSLLTTLARRQLDLGQSAILDAYVIDPVIRAAWVAAADEYDVPLRVLECVCSDELEHRKRIETRQRSIPGGREIDWEHALRLTNLYEDWPGERLLLDAVDPLERNVNAARKYCGLA